jgi:aconitase B
MSKPISLQKVIEYVEALSAEEQDLLLELIYKRRVEQRRKEIAKNAAQTLEAITADTAKRGTIADLRANLLNEE